MRAELDLAKCALSDGLAKYVMADALCLLLLLRCLLLRSLGRCHHVLEGRVSPLMLVSCVIWGRVVDVAERVVAEGIGFLVVNRHKWLHVSFFHYFLCC